MLITLMTESPLPHTARRPSRTIVAAVACAVLLATALVVYLSTRSSPRHRVEVEAAAQAPAPTVSAVPSTPAPVVAPDPGPPHDYVAPAVPTKFTLTGPRFTIKARVCSMAPVFPLDPPGDQHHTVCWVTRGFGVAPGSRSRTSYLLGHSWAPDPQEVLNKASEVATREILRVKSRQLSGATIYPVKGLTGYKLVLRTATGILTYRVHDSYGVPKRQLGLIKSAIDPTIPKRVVVITCAELNGTDYDYNVVLNAFLVSSKRRPVA
jgi:hypothetical protein